MIMEGEGGKQHFMSKEKKTKKDYSYVAASITVTVRNSLTGQDGGDGLP